MENHIIYSNLYDLIKNDEIEDYIYKHMGGFENNLEQVCAYYLENCGDIPELALVVTASGNRNGILDIFYKVIKPKLRTELDKWVFINTYSFVEAYNCFIEELKKYEVTTTDNFYLVALATGGEMGGNPEIIYTDYKRVKAKSEKEAVKKYNEQMKCSYYYGKCLGQLDDNDNLIKKINYSDLELLS